VKRYVVLTDRLSRKGGQFFEEYELPPQSIERLLADGHIELAPPKSPDAA
jgi:hypothetical protein